MVERGRKGLWVVLSRKYQSFHLRAKQGRIFPCLKEEQSPTLLLGALVIPCDDNILVSFLDTFS